MNSQSLLEAEVAVQEAASSPTAEYGHEHPMVDILACNAEKVTGAQSHWRF
jgi:hypothetical protein